MASGTITGSVYKSSGAATTGYKVRMVWSSTTNVSGNYSLVTVSLQICKNDGYDSSYTYNGSITINGTSTNYSKYVTVPKSGAWTEIGKVTDQVVYHNNDGSKSCSISATGTSTSSSFSSLGGWNTSSVTLDTIPRASSIDSVSNTNFGNSPTLKWTPKNANFKYRVKYAFGSSNTGWTSVISPGSTSQQSYSGLDIPQSWMNGIPSAAFGTVTAYLMTEDSSGNQVGDIATKTFTGSVPGSVVPTISSFSATRVDNGVPSDWDVYVQGKSKCTISMTGTGVYNSSIKESYILQNSSRIKTSSSVGSSVTTSVTAGPFLSSGTITFSGGVTDSRSRQTTTTSGQNKSITVIRYAAPQITSVLSQRCLQDGTLNDEGTYIKCTCTYKYWSVNGKNAVVCEVNYNTGSEGWSPQTALYTTTSEPGSDSETIVTATSIIGDGGIGTDNTYNLEYIVTDTLGGSSLSTDIVSTTFALMDFRSTGGGMAVGKVSEQDAFECALKAIFTGGIEAPEVQHIANSVGTWNQLIPNSLANTYYNDSFDSSTGVHTLTLRNSSITWARMGCSVPNGHKFLFKITSDPDLVDALRLYKEGSDGLLNEFSDGVGEGIEIMDNAFNWFSFQFENYWSSHSSASLKCIVIDLTAMGLDSIMTVGQFEKLFSFDYYPYHRFTDDLSYSRPFKSAQGTAQNAALLRDSQNVLYPIPPVINLSGEAGLTDLNDLEYSGFYCTNSDYAPRNKPSGAGTWCFIINFKYATNRSQICIDEVSNTIYHRGYGNSWTAWKKVTSTAI